jgi:ribosomal protein L32
MAALTGDFHVFASGVTAFVSAVLLTVCYIAKAWYVRAFFRPLISHQLSPIALVAQRFAKVVRRLTDCMQISKRPTCGNTRLSNAVAQQCKQTKLSRVSTCR